MEKGKKTFTEAKIWYKCLIGLCNIYINYLLWEQGMVCNNLLLYSQSDKISCFFLCLHYITCFLHIDSKSAILWILVYGKEIKPSYQVLRVSCLVHIYI